MITIPKRDHLLIGVALNIVGTFVGLLVIYLFVDMSKPTAFKTYMANMSTPSEFSAKILALSQLINIPTFYYLSKRNMRKSFRGMLLMFFVYIAYTILVKFVI